MPMFIWSMELMMLISLEETLTFLKAKSSESLGRMKKSIYHGMRVLFRPYLDSFACYPKS